MDILGPADVMMSHWNVIVIIKQGVQVEKFLGYCHERETYRISSQIESYDSENSVGKTLSGSRYYFLDKPGNLHPSAQSIFDQLTAYVDVTVSLKY